MFPLSNNSRTGIFRLRLIFICFCLRVGENICAMFHHSLFSTHFLNSCCIWIILDNSIFSNQMNNRNTTVLFYSVLKQRCFLYSTHEIKYEMQTTMRLVYDKKKKKKIQFFIWNYRFSPAIYYNSWFDGYPCVNMATLARTMRIVERHSSGGRRPWRRQ